MSKEKRNNLAIYTLAGSILISSVLVSINQANGVPTDSQISSLKSCINNNFKNVDFALYDISRGSKPFFNLRTC